MAIKRLLSLPCLGLAALSMAWADYSVQDFAINVNGAVTDQAYGVSGVSTTGWNQATGIGTLTYTFSASPGTYFVNFFLDPSTAVPFYNEYGIVGGTPGAGVSYQVDDSFNGTVYTNFAAGSANQLDNHNDLPGTGDNYHNSCAYVSGGACNGDVAFGVGYKFTLAANQSAVFSLAGSSTAPTGFYLEDVHPVDAGNSAAADYFLSPSLTIENGIMPPPPPTAPEPGNLALIGSGLLSFVLVWRKVRRTATH